MDISRNIIRIRENKGIKQSEMAIKLEIDQPYYSRIEKKGDKLTLETIKLIADALEVPLEDIFGFETKKANSENEILKEQLKDKTELLEKERKLIKDFSNEIIEKFKSNVAHYNFYIYGDGTSYCVVKNAKTKKQYILRDNKEDSVLNLKSLYNETIQKEWINLIGNYDKSDISIDFKIYDESYKKAFETYFNRMDEEYVYYGDLEFLWFLRQFDLINDPVISETYEVWLKKHNHI